jgi:hypothetical protein
MPESVLRELPSGWQQRATQKEIEKLNLLPPKLKRNEPRDRAHADWAKRIGLLG